MFARLIAGHLPIVLSCSAGKDRTGLASALVLAALGVSWKDIIDDYCLTNELVDLERIYFKRNTAAEKLDELHQSYAKLSQYDRAPLLVASPAYLEAAFNAMRTKHGSLESYLESALGVSRVHVDRLRDALLVD
jgi:protein-tyrosine phosphatase